ncbi:YhcN/YlaJ family sporulation lipoprotein [Salirhabdus salicampi]|uniref:YhcN/YlaJ family sporulation lipoprotein n=1 Tax=Salirhabdus salicampi TaxID=476102 RepID=UPI0020C44406|nr:YhcN/YlaJ family sporulation lipoprotein [Salirhabdus salicampi]MCP8615328.1 YhcN/YlaJ family sporulation lipoprotein [Salirhabdus salicampi]
MNKLALLGVSFLTAVTVTGCQNPDDTGLGGYNDDTGVEPTRYNQNTDLDPNRDRVRMNQNELGMRNNDDYNNPARNNGNNLTNNGENDRNNIGTRNNNADDRYEVADRAADQITNEIDEIDRAYVLVTNNNAYVAVVMDNNNTTNNNNGDEVSDRLSDRVSDIVRSTDRNINNVYVSANPDFANLANNYTRDVDRGEPVEGFFDQLTNMVDRLFPDRR